MKNKGTFFRSFSWKGSVGKFLGFVVQTVYVVHSTDIIVQKQLHMVQKQQEQWCANKTLFTKRIKLDLPWRQVPVCHFLTWTFSL